MNWQNFLFSVPIVHELFLELRVINSHELAELLVHF